MLLIRSVLFEFLIYVWMIFLGILCFPLAIFSRGACYWIMRFYCRSVFFLARVMLGLRVEIRGKIPSGAVMIASKHQSFLDVLMHFEAMPRARFVIKKELRWVPIFGFYALRIGSTPVARGKKGAAVKSMIDHVESESDEGGQLIIYPQGTRVAPGADMPYKVGAGVIYDRMQQVCIPAATNTGYFWGKRALLKKPGVAVIEYLEPVEKGLPIKEFMAIIEDRIEVASDKLHEEAKDT